MGVLKTFKEDDDWCVMSMGFLETFKEYDDCGKEHEVPFFLKMMIRSRSMG